MRTIRKTALLAAVAATTGAFGMQEAHAITYIWDGTGTNTNWSTAANWTADLGTPSVGGAGGDVALFDNTGVLNLANTVDVNTSITQLAYRQDAPTNVYTTSIDRSATLTISGLTGSNAAAPANSGLLVMPTTAAGNGAPTGARVVIQSTGVGAQGGLNITSGNVQISGRPGASVDSPSYAILDLSNLDSFNYSQATNSTFSIGGGNGAGNSDTNSYWGQLILSNNSTIRTNRLVIGGQNNTGTQGTQPVSSLLLGQSTTLNSTLPGNLYVGSDPTAAKTSSGALMFRAGVTNGSMSMGDTLGNRNGWEIARHRFQTTNTNFGVADFTSASGTTEGAINANTATITISAQSGGVAGAGGGFGMLSMNKGTIDTQAMVITRTTSNATAGGVNVGVFNVGLKGAGTDTGGGIVLVSGTISLGQRIATDTSSGGSLNSILNLANNGAITVDRLFVGNNTVAGGTQAVNATVNLNGGTLTTAQIKAGSDTAQAGTTSRLINFNGATVKVKTGASQVNRDTFLEGHTAATVNAGGANFDTNAQDIIVNQPLVAPTGDGVQSITVDNGGSGYRVAPIVLITGGGGTGASAVARIDAAGSVVGLDVTNP
ncbi:MAG: fibronectin-binding autotransporter adhesin, partial [Phycisphaerales bacterium]|nr:fibronectin-binding autotransporter adhesin [Phycisphaerales bacterium]